MDEYLQKFQTNYTKTDGLSSNDIRAIVVDKNDQVWVGTSNGLCRLKGETWICVLSINNISALLADGDGKIWIAAGDRLLDGEGKTAFRISGAIQVITEDNKGQLWIASQYQICCRIEEKWQCFAAPEIQKIRAIRLDHNQCVWIATNAGLIRCDSQGERY